MQKRMMKKNWGKHMKFWDKKEGVKKKEKTTKTVMLAKAKSHPKKSHRHHHHGHGLHHLKHKLKWLLPLVFLLGLLGLLLCRRMRRNAALQQTYQQLSSNAADDAALAFALEMSMKGSATTVTMPVGQDSTPAMPVDVSLVAGAPAP